METQPPLTNMAKMNCILFYENLLLCNWRFIWVSRLLKGMLEECGAYQGLQFEGEVAIGGEQKYKRCHAQILGILLLGLSTFLCPLVPHL